MRRAGCALLALCLVSACGPYRSTANITRVVVYDPYAFRDVHALSYKRATSKMTARYNNHATIFAFPDGQIASLPLADLAWVAKHGEVSLPVTPYTALFMVGIRVDLRDAPPLSAHFSTQALDVDPPQLQRLRRWYAGFAAEAERDRSSDWHGDLRADIFHDRISEIQATIPYESSGFVHIHYTVTLYRDGRAHIHVALHRLREPLRFVDARGRFNPYAWNELATATNFLSPEAPDIAEHDPATHVLIVAPDQAFRATGSPYMGFAIFYAHINQLVRDINWQPAVPWPPQT